MKYYVETQWILDENGRSTGNHYFKIHEYDTANGVVTFVNSDIIVIWHRSLIVHDLFDTLDEAIRSLNYSRVPAMLPDGKMITPLYYNDPMSSGDVFQRWHPGVVELWPGEY